MDNDQPRPHIRYYDLKKWWFKEAVKNGGFIERKGKTVEDIDSDFQRLFGDSTNE